MGYRIINGDNKKVLFPSIDEELFEFFIDSGNRIRRMMSALDYWYIFSKNFSQMKTWFVNVDPFGEMFFHESNRYFFNTLSSYTALVSFYERTLKELDLKMEYAEASHVIYDNNLEYRLFKNLRDYATHCGYLPITNANVNMKQDEGWSMRVEIDARKVYEYGRYQRDWNVLSEKDFQTMIAKDENINIEAFIQNGESVMHEYQKKAFDLLNSVIQKDIIRLSPYLVGKPLPTCPIFVINNESDEIVLDIAAPICLCAKKLEAYAFKDPLITWHHDNSDQTKIKS